MIISGSRSHKVKDIKDAEDGGFTGSGDMNEAMMSLPAALAVACRQGQTAQQRLVYPTVKKQHVFVFSSFAFLVSLRKPSLAATNRKHIGHF